MSRDEQHLTGLTRSLLLTAAVGTVPLLQVGCAPLVGSTSTASSSAPVLASATYATEDVLCARLLERRTAADAELLMRSHPDASCIPAALAALPPNVLAAIPPAAVSGLSQRVRDLIPPQTARSLRMVQAAPATPATPRAPADQGRSY